LPEGAHFFVMRPDGFDRWTFAPGTEDPDRAVPLLLEAAKSEDLGPLEIDRGPTVRVEPDIQTKEDVPDLRDAVLTVVAERLSDPGKNAPAGKNTAPSNDGGRGLPAAKDPAPSKD